MTGSGKDDRLEDYRVVRIGEGVAGEGFFEPDRGGDVAGVDRVDLFAVVGVHLEDAADPLFLALGGVVDVRAGVERARVDPEVGQLADVRIRGDLEGKSGEGLAVGRGSDDFLAGDRAFSDDRRDVQRRRQVVDHGVEHRLDTLVLQGRARQNRDDAVLERAETKAPLDVGFAQAVAFEVLVSQLVIHLGDDLDHPLPLGAGGLE